MNQPRSFPETQARINLAGVRECIDMLERDEAHRIYQELMRLSHKLALRHDFAIEKDKRMVKSKL